MKRIRKIDDDGKVRTTVSDPESWDGRRRKEKIEGVLD